MTGCFSAFSGLDRRKWMTLLVFGLADFCQAVCVSLQAPFYPQEAERKGASPTAYGLVFGIFELTVFIVSPIFGRNLATLGARRLFNCGLLTTGSCCVIFGLLDHINSTVWFIASSLAVRALEAAGNAAFLTATFSIIAAEFPDHVATMFACLETCFGIGLIVGPTVGGALYDVGGYALPFVTLGGVLVASAVLAIIILPDRKFRDQHQQLPQEQTDGPGDEGITDSSSVERFSITAALSMPRAVLFVASILFASCSIGFLVATLEPHLRQFQLSALMIGLMFVINGAFYALFAPLFGVLCDKVVSPRFCNFIGCLAITTSYITLGPSPLLPIPRATLALVISSLIVNGFGLGAVLVSSFAGIHREALNKGYPDDLSTYGVVSALWTSSFALGAFIGPSVGGLLLDYFGFRFSTFFMLGLGFVILAGSIGFHFRRQILSKCCLSRQRLDHGLDSPGSGNSGIFIFDANRNGYTIIGDGDIESPEDYKYDCSRGGKTSKMHSHFHLAQQQQQQKKNFRGNGRSERKRDHSSGYTTKSSSSSDAGDVAAADSDGSYPGEPPMGQADAINICDAATDGRWKRDIRFNGTK